MINILKAGKPGRRIRTIYTHECSLCGCRFEYEKDDVEEEPYGIPAIECPCCHMHSIAYEDKYYIVEVEEIK
jgi:hypothetical protein